LREKENKEKKITPTPSVLPLQHFDPLPSSRYPPLPQSPRRHRPTSQQIGIGGVPRRRRRATRARLSLRDTAGDGRRMRSKRVGQRRPPGPGERQQLRMGDEAAAASSLQAAAALASLHLPQPEPTGGRRRALFILVSFIFCEMLLARLLHLSLLPSPILKRTSR
jgi:hypothetical protein